MDVFLSPPARLRADPAWRSSATTGGISVGDWNALTLGGGGAIAGCGACACINVGCRSPAGGAAKPIRTPRPLRGAGCFFPRTPAWLLRSPPGPLARPAGCRHRLGVGIIFGGLVLQRRPRQRRVEPRSVSLLAQPPAAIADGH